jgi:hypothetical protein
LRECGTGVRKAGVDGLEQRPGHGLRRPRIVVDRAGDLGDQRGRGAERHPGADPVGRRETGAEHVREPLAQPAFHAARRHQHELLGERIGKRIGQQPAEPVGEEVGAISTMEMKRHREPR